MTGDIGRYWGFWKPGALLFGGEIPIVRTLASPGRLILGSPIYERYHPYLYIYISTYIYIYISVYVAICMHGCTDACMDERMDGQTEVWMNGGTYLDRGPMQVFGGFQFKVSLLCPNLSRFVSEIWQGFMRIEDFLGQQGK